MAESKGALIAKSVSKHAGRAKEKILQNLGKVDRTADEIFDDHMQNFNLQQASAAKLQKEFNTYIRCIRAAQMASKSLMNAIYEVYECQWEGYDSLLAQGNKVDALWQDFSYKLGDQVLIPLNTYTSQFPEMKKKIEKRNRKLIDYDFHRHSFHNLQSSKRKDDSKVSKSKEQLEEARQTYEVLNSELHDELPALHDSRLLFLVTNLQTLFASERIFHTETSKVYCDLEAITDKLAADSQKQMFDLKKTEANTIIKTLTSPFMKGFNENDITNGANNSDLPQEVLYRVKATYSYVKEDDDEISFDVGEIINVIEFDDPNDQEEGWLMGCKEGTKTKGLFPANFTRPI